MIVHVFYFEKCDLTLTFYVFKDKFYAIHSSLSKSCRKLIEKFHEHICKFVEHVRYSLLENVNLDFLKCPNQFSEHTSLTSGYQTTADNFSSKYNFFDTSELEIFSLMNHTTDLHWWFRKHFILS